MAVGMKRKRTDEAVDVAVPLPQKVAKSPLNRTILKESVSVPEDMEPQLQRIAASNRTLFEKKVVSFSSDNSASRPFYP